MSMRSEKKCEAQIKVSLTMMIIIQHTITVFPHLGVAYVRAHTIQMKRQRKSETMMKITG